MPVFDLGLAYVWEFDEDFIDLIELEARKNNLKTFRITNDNFYEVYRLVKKSELKFKSYFDRAADVDEEFEELNAFLEARGTQMINPHKKVLHAIDKATMHLEFISAGLDVPYSIIIPPHTDFENIFISVDDLRVLGRPFIIKPCNNTGGGVGVVTGAESLKDILTERRKNSDDKYIIQEKIYPKIFNGKRAWFRCFWAFNEVIPVWWDDQTHLYSMLSTDEIKNFRLKKLFTSTKKIAEITKLNF